MDNYTASYKKLERLAKKKKKSMYSIAKDVGIAQSTLSDWKNGRYIPKVDKLSRLADYFGVSVEYFYER